MTGILGPNEKAPAGFGMRVPQPTVVGKAVDSGNERTAFAPTTTPLKPGGNAVVILQKLLNGTVVMLEVLNNEAGMRTTTFVDIEEWRRMVQKFDTDYWIARVVNAEKRGREMGETATRIKLTQERLAAARKKAAAARRRGRRKARR